MSVEALFTSSLPAFNVLATEGAFRVAEALRLPEARWVRLSLQCAIFGLLTALILVSTVAAGLFLVSEFQGAPA